MRFGEGASKEGRFPTAQNRIVDHISAVGKPPLRWGDRRKCYNRIVGKVQGLPAEGWLRLRRAAIFAVKLFWLFLWLRPPSRGAKSSALTRDHRGESPRKTCRTAETISSTRNTKNKILAMSEAAPAMPVKPKRAAMIATMKKVMAQLSMGGW